MLRLILALKGRIDGALSGRAHRLPHEASCRISRRGYFTSEFTSRRLAILLWTASITPLLTTCQSIGTPGQAGLAVEATLHYPNGPTSVSEEYEIGKSMPPTSRHRHTSLDV
jgi:hypothetical protein